MSRGNLVGRSPIDPHAKLDDRESHGKRMLTDASANASTPSGASERVYLESLIRRDYEMCHPDESFDDLKRRARFSKEDKGLLRDWMAVAARRRTRSLDQDRR